MKLNIHNSDFARIISCLKQINISQEWIDYAVYDTRLIHSQPRLVFFALNYGKGNGLDYIEKAFQKGVRHFVCSELPPILKLEANYYLVKNTLESLQLLAIYKRKLFNGKVSAITGTLGKTTFKEWAYSVLSPHLSIYRGPKSYNSQLGVAISILNADLNTDFWLIEAGISEKNEMEKLQKMILPNYGVFTHFGIGHGANFESQEAYFNEKCLLFSDVKKCFAPNEKKFQSNNLIPWEFPSSSAKLAIEKLKFEEISSKNNLTLVYTLCEFLQISEDKILMEMQKLEHLALRLETFEGIYSSTIINDSYTLDFDSFMEALSYQKQVAQKQKRVLILNESDKFQEFKEIALRAGVDVVLCVERFNKETEASVLQNSVVLIKGNTKSSIAVLSQFLKLKKHKTKLTINLTEIKNNIAHLTKHFPKKVKILAMVKAAGYGTGAEHLSLYLQRIGVDYLGVAYADEGVELRKAGVTLPILVMNAEEEAFADIVLWNLEPAIYNLKQLDYFISTCINLGKYNHPIQLKLETGMHRLGLEEIELKAVLQLILAQPEVTVTGVYSHLADSDNLMNRTYTERQLLKFDKMCSIVESNLSYTFSKHILNSEGVANFPNAFYDMVRLGIGMYGFVADPKIQLGLQPVVTWSSSVSQIKKLSKGDAVGYGASFVAYKEMSIAVIPVGYADGFKRFLGNGVGSVYINNQQCPTIGRVCMDMIMVDVSNLEVIRGDKVEIIGENQTLDAFAKLNNTIVYEILTSISKRVHRVYLEE